MRDPRQGSGSRSTVGIGRLAFVGVQYELAVEGNLLYSENRTSGRHPSIPN